MTAQSFDFSQLIEPIHPSVFLKDYWRKKILHIPRQQKNYYSGLFSLQELDQLLQLHRLKYPQITTITDRTEWLDFLDGMNVSALEQYGVPDVFRLYRSYVEGDTFIIHRLHQNWQAIAALCLSIAEFWTYPVSAHLFIAQKDSEGCSPHYDQDEIFVLQLEGGKRWRFYNTTAPASPDLYRHPGANEQLSPPEQEIYLEAGDLLYVPAGCVHGVRPVHESSVHLTIGMLPFTGMDLLKNAIVSVQTHPMFAEALPINWCNSSAEMHEKLITLIQQLPQEVQLGSAIAPLAQQFLDELPTLPQGNFSAQDLKLNSEIAQRLATLETQ